MRRGRSSPSLGGDVGRMGVVRLKISIFPLAAILLGFGMVWAIEAPKKKAAPKSAVKKAPASKAPARGRTATYSRGRTRGRSPQPVAQRRVPALAGRWARLEAARVAGGLALAVPPAAGRLVLLFAVTIFMLLARRHRPPARIERRRRPHCNAGDCGPPLPHCPRVAYLCTT